jgi:hypothetical protein
MGVRQRAQGPLILVGLALCVGGLYFGLNEPYRYDTGCGQPLWNGDTRLCEELVDHGWRAGILIGLGLACFALTFRRWLVAVIAIAGLALIGFGGLRAFQSPDVEGRGRSCGSLVGIDPELFGVGVDDEYDIDPVLDHRRAECRDALLDQGAVVAAFIALGGVLLGVSRSLADQLGAGSREVVSQRVTSSL